MDKPKYKITIKTKDNDERYKIGEHIHNQLVGNRDYIDCNIILNCTDVDCTVLLMIFEECTDIPPISLF